MSSAVYSDGIRGSMESPNEGFHVSDWPSAKSEFWLCQDFMVTSMHKQPNAWWRFWQWVFFGFKWKALDR